MSDSADVIAANDAFYRAFAARDLAAMEALWARRAPVACIHPGWDVLTDRDQVMASWAAILGNPAAPQIRYHDPEAFLLGDAAFVICGEMVFGTRLVATNTFVREDGAWRMVHHQASQVAAPEKARPRRGDSPGATVH